MAAPQYKDKLAKDVKKKHVFALDNNKLSSFYIPHLSNGSYLLQSKDYFLDKFRLYIEAS